MGKVFVFQGNPASNGVSVDQLRAQATTRLNAAYLKIDPRASFNNTAKSGGVDSLLGSMLFNALVGGALCHAFAAVAPNTHIDLDAEILPGVSIAGAVEAVNLLSDDQADRIRRRTPLYPQGRRQDPIVNRPLKRFNMVAANDCERFASDPRAEIACMSEILDMLDTLDKHGVDMVRIEPDKDAYAALKNEVKAAKTRGIFRVA